MKEVVSDLKIECFQWINRVRIGKVNINLRTNSSTEGLTCLSNITAKRSWNKHLKREGMSQLGL